MHDKLLPVSAVKFAVATAYLLNSVTSLANEQDLLTVDDLESDFPVTSSVSHLPQRIADAPVAVTIIDQEMIAASGAMTPVEVFRLIPGFNGYYVHGNTYGINYHALGDEYPRRLEVKVDGRPVYEPLFPTVEWVSLGIEMQDIAYIEAVRGPNQAADGTNAFLGTINIVTRSPVGDEGTSVRATVGYRQERRLSAVHRVQLGDVHNRFTISHQQNRGFPDPPGDRKLDDELKTTHLGYRGIWTPNIKDTVDFQAGLTLSTNGVGAGGDGGEPDEVRPRKYNYTYQSAKWERNHNDTHDFQLIFYHTYMEIEEDNIEVGYLSDFAPVPPALDFEFEQIEVKGKTQRADLEFRHLLNLTNQFRMNWGAAARYDRAKGEILLGTDDWVGENFYRLYTNMEWRPIELITLNLGVMAEKNSLIPAYASPRFSINFHPSPEHTIRLGYSRGYRSPAILEANALQVYSGFMAVNDHPLGPLICSDPDAQPLCENPQYQVVSDPNITKEEIRNYELSYYGHLPLQGLTLDAKFFHEDITDIMDEQVRRDVPGDADGIVVVRTNNGMLKTWGAEFGLDYRPIPEVLIAGQYTQIRLEGNRHRRTNPDEFEDWETILPERTWNVLFRYTLPINVDLGFNLYSQSGVDWIRGDDIKPFNRLDLRAAWRFKIGNTNSQLEFIVQNVMDNSNQEYHYFNYLERRGYVRYSIDFP